MEDGALSEPLEAFHQAGLDPFIKLRVHDDYKDSYYTTIKKIVGHSGAMTLTERVYTHLDVQILINAVNKIVGNSENGEEGK